ncbi:MAG: TonB-dependent receptor [Rubrivivax sp.]|nr:TonB-dependent receptor [Rubrivivax sp.]
MKTFNPQSSRARAVLQATPVAAAVAALLCSTGLAQAQQAAAAPQVTETVVVTGIRRGIESAISVKKNADSIVEAISAEDLGKLPDTSIAESISRLPGVAAQRTDGRAQQISIRGMAPDFGTTLLNGREQASTGDSRSAEFDQYPSELINGVLIYKTPDGALVGQGLSGTVDMQTVRPLDRPAREVALAYRKSKLNVGSSGTEGDGHRFSIFYVDQFADRTIGVALGFARLDETGGVTSRFESWGSGTAKLNGAGVDLSVPYNGFNAWADQETRKRDGWSATLQYKPSKDFTSTLDVLISKFDKVQSRTGFQAPLNDSWNPAVGGNYDTAGVLTQATVSGTSVTAGTFNNVRGVVRNDSESTKDKMSSIGWNNKFKLGDTWTVNTDLSQSHAERTGGIIETTAGTAQSALGTAQLDTVQFTSAGNFTPGLNYTDRSIIKLTDVQGWGGGVTSPQAGYSKLPYVDDKLTGIRASLKRDLALGPIVNVEGGLHFSDREKTRSFTEGRLVIKGSDPLASVAMPGTGTMAVSTPGGGSILVPTFDSSTSVGTIYDVVRKLHPDIYNKDWTTKEKVTTLFSKGDIDGTVAGLALRGNVGLQIVATDQSSTAYNVDRTTCASDVVCPAASNTAGATYTDFLPSLNLVSDFGASGTVRFAVARVMARPKVDDMRASSSFSYDATKGLLTGGGGNPELKPFRANAVDLSYEKYFGTKAYIGVAGFYKQLSSYIVNLTNTNYDFSRYVTPGTVIPPGLNLTGEFTQPVNGSGGNISGIELSGSLPLNMVAGVLDGFGMFASFSNTTSSLNLATTGLATDAVATSTIPLPGLSKRVTNYGVYFEKWGFSARVAARSRSDFVGEVTDGVGDRRLTYIKGETITDAQIGYEIQSGALKGLALRIEVSNAGNTDYVRYRDLPSNEVERKKDGKFYQFGLNYKL